MEKAVPFKRYHNPNAPLTRTSFEKSILWIFETIVITLLYYFLSENLGGGIIMIMFQIKDPASIPSFPLGFWLSIMVIIVLAKIFKPSTVVLGAIVGEVIMEYLHFYQTYWFLVLFPGILALIEGFFPYKGGEYYRAKHIFTQNLRVLLIFIGYLPILYYGLTTVSLTTETMSTPNLRAYILLNFLVNNLFIMIPAWGVLYLLDRFLVPYFPLSKEDQAKLDQIDQFNHASTVESDFEDLFPQPGEVYIEFLTHHPLYTDNHTIVVNIGKVRVYLCTRCTAMILGVFISFMLTLLIVYDFNIDVNGKTAAWIALTLPILPLSDWGFQALHIRPANTKSRLITGFILGVSMQMLTFTQDYQVPVFIMIIIYFGIFYLLMRARNNIEEKLAEKADFDSKFSEPIPISDDQMGMNEENHEE